jgi:hypothetical protein
MRALVIERLFRHGNISEIRRSLLIAKGFKVGARRVLSLDPLLTKKRQRLLSSRIYLYWILGEQASRLRRR